MFRSIDEGGVIANDIMVAGYVVMRIAMVLQWLRAAKEHPAGRATALRYAFFVTASQVAWVLLLFLRETPAPVFLAALVITLALDLGGPWLAERAGKTTWHPQHIAERYGLLAIIALGEGIIGTIAAVSAVVDHQGWSTEAGTPRRRRDRTDVRDVVVLLHAAVRHRAGRPSRAVLGVGLFARLPLRLDRRDGAGLHVAAFQLEGEAHIGNTAAVLTVAVPVLVFGLAIFAIYTWLVRELDPFHFLLYGVMVGLLALSVLLASGGLSLGWCLIVAMLAPVAVVVGYETLGHQASRKPSWSASLLRDQRLQAGNLLLELTELLQDRRVCPQVRLHGALERLALPLHGLDGDRDEQVQAR